MKYTSKVKREHQQHLSPDFHPINFSQLKSNIEPVSRKIKNARHGQLATSSCTNPATFSERDALQAASEAHLPPPGGRFRFPSGVQHKNQPLGPHPLGRRARRTPLPRLPRWWGRLPPRKITRRHFFPCKKGGESSLLKLPLDGACVRPLRCSSKVYSAVALSL